VGYRDDTLLDFSGVDASEVEFAEEIDPLLDLVLGGEIGL
jgi:hypothetical protein